MMPNMSNTNIRVREAVSQDTSVQNTTAQIADTGVKCPYCGGAVAADDEICPHCGARLTSDCTFCGTPLLPGEIECPECGMPVGGVRCPECGTLNHRAFCRCCNAPLTRAAVKAVEKAKADPLFQECEMMADKLSAMEKEIAAAAPEEAAILKTEQKKLVCSLNERLSRMLPPPGSTPKEQMIYYSARKVAVNVRSVTREKVGWVCNYCGCTHSRPAECTKPQLGGHWVYEEKETIYTTYR